MWWAAKHSRVFHFPREHQNQDHQSACHSEDRHRIGDHVPHLPVWMLTEDRRRAGLCRWATRELCTVSSPALHYWRTTATAAWRAVWTLNTHAHRTQSYQRQLNSDQVTHSAGPHKSYTRLKRVEHRNFILPYYLISPPCHHSNEVKCQSLKGKYKI